MTSVLVGQLESFNVNIGRSSLKLGSPNHSLLKLETLKIKLFEDSENLHILEMFDPLPVLCKLQVLIVCIKSPLIDHPPPLCKDNFVMSPYQKRVWEVFEKNRADFVWQKYLLKGYFINCEKAKPLKVTSRYNYQMSRRSYMDNWGGLSNWH